MIKKILNILVIGIAIIASILLVFVELPTTFNVTARTEFLSFVTPTDGPIPRWHLSKALILRPPDGRTVRFTGDLQPKNGVKSTFERIASGQLTISLVGTSIDGSVAILYDRHGQPSGPLPSGTVIQVGDLEARTKVGERVLMAIVGRVQVGRVPTLSSLGYNPLLLSGRVAMLGRTVLGNRTFNAGTTELDYGDMFSVDNSGSPFSGFVVLDENPALLVAVRVLAQEGRVTRFLADGYKVYTSPYARILNDPVIQGLWVTFLFLLGAYRYVVKSK